MGSLCLGDPDSPGVRGRMMGCSSQGWAFVWKHLHAQRPCVDPNTIDGWPWVNHREPIQGSAVEGCSGVNHRELAQGQPRSCPRGLHGGVESPQQTGGRGVAIIRG